ncbi:protease IV [Gammaproteobacteria bacterium]
MPMTSNDNLAPEADHDTSRDWERALIHRLALEAVTEQRRARRWGILFKLLIFIYIAIILVVFLEPDWPDLLSLNRVGESHTALVDVKGVIASDAKANAEDIVSSLRKAFEDDKTKGVILRINSPGGSPVQAGLVYDEIRRLRKKYPDIPIHAVVADLCASGGYFIAAAADRIYANRASIVGSIGVLMNGFGFVDTLKTLGVERRLLTAGEHKALLDPFLPTKRFDAQYIQSVLDQLHQQFIHAVQEGRGNRLTNDPQLFTGLFWSGEESLKLGLVDGFGDVGYVAREIIGAEPVVDFTAKKDFIRRLSEQFGTRIVTAMVEMMGGFGTGWLIQ